MTRGEPRWTIAELGERISAALARVGYQGPANGQVRAVPDQRTIRYYTTLGLLDRPAAMRGRTAFYGLRHLLQLLAVKRLQAEGRSLGEVQAALTGLDDAGLAALAGVSAREAAALAPVAAAVAPAIAATADETAPPRRDFWAAAPAPLAARSPTAGSIDPAPPAFDPGARGPSRPPPAMTTMTRIDLAPGVSLVIDTAGSGGALRPGDAPFDPSELARAAAPLLAALRRQGLARDDHEEETA